MIGLMVGGVIVPSFATAEDCAPGTLPVINTGITGGTTGECVTQSEAAERLAAQQRSSVNDWIAENLYWAVTALGRFIAWMGGSLLDFSISIFTIGMAGTADTLGLKEVVRTIWEIVRDLFNIVFIFGLIWAGFRMILWADDSSSKRLIGSIVVAALLINFSLYVTQVIVDFTNLTAYQIFSAMDVPQDRQWTPIAGYQVYSLSSTFIEATELSRLGTSTSQVAGQAAASGNAETRIVPTGIAGAVVLGLVMLLFYGLLGFIFFAGAFILFSRFIALLFLMMFSPIMFLGSIFPQMKSYTSKWWSYLLKQAMVAPVFLFMLYISLRILQKFEEVRVSDSFVSNGLISITLLVLIVAAFLIASLKMAQSMSSWGAAQAANAGNALQRLALTGVARGMQNTAGRYMQSRAEKGAEAAANGGFLRRGVWNMQRRLGDASFDLRNAPGGKKLDMGEGVKGGYKSRTEAIAKREKEYAEKLGTVDDDDPRVARLKTAVDAQEQAIKTKNGKIRDEQREITELENSKKDQNKEEQEKTQQEINVKKARITQYRGEIDKHKEEVDKAKEAVQREKQRRQLGASLIGTQTQKIVDDKKDFIKDKLNAYAETKDPATQEQLAKDIAEAKKELAEAEKTANKEAGGFATTVENYGFIKNWFMGRDKSQNENAGKEIRDEYKKKIKSKDK